MFLDGEDLQREQKKVGGEGGDSPSWLSQMYCQTEQLHFKISSFL